VGRCDTTGTPIHSRFAVAARSWEKHSFWITVISVKRLLRTIETKCHAKFRLFEGLAATVPAGTVKQLPWRRALCSIAESDWLEIENLKKRSVRTLSDLRSLAATGVRSAHTIHDNEVPLPADRGSFPEYLRTASRKGIRVMAAHARMRTLPRLQCRKGHRSKKPAQKHRLF
jgi:hypothetical protein